MTGIALQTWDRHGWRGGFVQKYWLWRDRKGILGNPASLLTNVLFLLRSNSIAVWCAIARCPGDAMGAGSGCIPHRVPDGLCRTCVRHSMSRSPTPFRIVGGKLYQLGGDFRGIAAILQSPNGRADRLYGSRPITRILVSPRLQARQTRRELLVTNGYLEQHDINWALETKPNDLRLGEHLLRPVSWTRFRLRGAQPPAGRAANRVEPDSVKRSIARSLPARLASRHKLVPFKLDLGTLFVAGPELPTPEVRNEVGRFTSARVEFHLVTPRNYQQLVNEFLPA